MCGRILDESSMLPRSKLFDATASKTGVTLQGMSYIERQG